MKRFRFVKLNMKKISYGVGSLGIIAILIGTSVDWSNTSMIFAIGSSSVYPLMVEMSDAYKDADVTVSSGGSSTGVEKIKNNLTNLGNASRSPNIDEAGEPSHPVTGWNDNKLKTVTIGWDGIAVVYKPANKNDQLIINNDNIDEIYRAFAGTKKISMRDLYVPSMAKTAPNWKSNEQESIIPFARTGGAMVSGTAEAFLKSSGLDTSNLDAKTKSILSGTDNYGAYVKQVPEANTQAWGQFDAAGDDGSMIYLSAGFVKNNYHDITKAGYSIAMYQGQDKKDKPTLPFDPVTNEMYVANDKPDHSYDWFRPFNTILSMNSKQDVKDFVSWMIDYKFDKTTKEPKNIQAHIMDKMGVVPLSDLQKESMYGVKNSNKHCFWVCDYDLINQDPNRIAVKHLYGAYNKPALSEVK